MPRLPGTAKPRSPRAAIQAVGVQMTEAECDDFDGWLRQATVAGGPCEPLIRFATWYPAVVQRWFDAAAASGVWEGGREPGRVARGYCRHPSQALSHAERGDGLVVHFVVDTTSRPYAFRARWCREAPEVPFTKHWTDDQRLTWEEFTGGQPCRGCGRGFVGAPEWKPILRRTPEEAGAIEREQAEFRALHPSCARMTWSYGSTGVTHCSECCPAPPLSPQQAKQIARIVVDMVQQQHQDALDLERRWRATEDATVR
jgi:hypothetical protein